MSTSPEHNESQPKALSISLNDWRWRVSELLGEPSFADIYDGDVLRLSTFFDNYTKNEFASRRLDLGNHDYEPEDFILESGSIYFESAGIRTRKSSRQHIVIDNPERLITSIQDISAATLGRGKALFTSEDSGVRNREILAIFKARLIDVIEMTLSGEIYKVRHSNPTAYSGITGVNPDSNSQNARISSFGSLIEAAANGNDISRRNDAGIFIAKLRTRSFDDIVNFQAFSQTVQAIDFAKQD